MRTNQVQLTLSFSRFATATRRTGKVVPTAIPALIAVLILSHPASAEKSPFDDDAPGKSQASSEKLTAVQFYARGTTKSSQKDYEGAVHDFDEAIRLNPKYGEAYGNRGSAKFNLKDFNGALSDYDVSLRFFPGNKALLGNKAQVEGVLRENANQASRAAAAVNQARMQAALGGGDFSDPSTMIMMNAQRRGLVAPTVDMSDPASIIMMNARRRGLVPQNTPNP